MQYFLSLSLKDQQKLTRLAEYMYDSDDCTNLQELAARAFLMGKGEKVDRPYAVGINDSYKDKK